MEVYLITMISIKLSLREIELLNFSYGLMNISKNYTKDISVKSIAAHLHITENHLIKLFKKKLNQTPNQYILELRLIYARYLILHSDESIQQIAYSCGFNTPSYFTKRFSQRYGMLPNELVKGKKA